jgi:hypothetical protein
VDSNIQYKPVSYQIANILNLSGDYWPAIIQAFIGLSVPVRESLYNYLLSQKIYLTQTIGQANYLAQKGDIVANQIQSLVGVINTILQPLDNFFKTFPIDSALKQIPEFSELMKSLSQSVPFNVPASISSQISEFAGFDFFDGVSSYQDLRDKIDELIFRSARASALSTYSSKATYYVDNQIDKINKYLDIIITLNAQGL